MDDPREVQHHSKERVGSLRKHSGEKGSANQFGAYFETAINRFDAQGHFPAAPHAKALWITHALCKEFNLSVPVWRGLVSPQDFSEIIRQNIQTKPVGVKFVNGLCRLPSRLSLRDLIWLL